MVMLVDYPLGTHKILALLLNVNPWLTYDQLLEKNASNLKRKQNKTTTATTKNYYSDVSRTVLVLLVGIRSQMRLHFPKGNLYQHSIHLNRSRS